MCVCVCKCECVCISVIDNDESDRKTPRRVYKYYYIIHSNETVSNDSEISVMQSEKNNNMNFIRTVYREQRVVIVV